MWVFQNKSFLSVVAHKDQSGYLLVRSRIKGDIESALPDAKVFEDTSADYRYRAIVSRDDFKNALSEAVDRIDYFNFKASVPGKARHDAYFAVWHAMASAFGAFVGRSSPTEDRGEVRIGDDDRDAS
jgi:hypothetical protein